MKTQILGYFIIAAILVIISPIHAHASFVSPKRVMINGDKKSAQVMIYNRTDTSMVYNFEWQHRILTSTGESKLLAEGETAEGYSPADPFLIFSPRQVVIRPGETQILRIFVKDQDKMADGEYHSHLLIRPEPVRKPTEKEIVKTKVTPNMSGSIQMKANLSIPVFVRRGETELNFDIPAYRFSKTEEGRTQLELDIDNNSTRSIYMKPELLCSKADGEVDKILLNTIRLYKQTRKFTRKLILSKKHPSVDYCKSIDLQLTGLDDFEYNRKVIKTIKIR